MNELEKSTKAAYEAGSGKKATAWGKLDAVTRGEFIRAMKKGIDAGDPPTKLALLASTQVGVPAAKVEKPAKD